MKTKKMPKGQACAWGRGALHMIHGSTCCQRIDECESDIARAWRGMVTAAAASPDEFMVALEDVAERIKKLETRKGVGL